MDCKIDCKKISLATIAIWIVSNILGFVTCGWLFNWVYQIPPNIWKTAEQVTGNMVWATLLGLIPAILFTVVFVILYKGIPGKGIKKGINYGIIVWLVSAFGGLMTMPFYMTISATVIIYWIIQSLVVNVVNGIIVAAIYKEK
ncbi:MAG: hypothetical protein U9R34_07640 [Nanoarchaeota archaeon]|nr:hypothetical protein [Nanoarchaeota archaeon]